MKLIDQFIEKQWRGVFIVLDKHLDGRNIDDLSNDEAQHWARSLVGDKRSAYTVKNRWISAPRIVLGWALKQKLITTNAFAGVSIRAPKKIPNREDGKAFSDVEQQVILKAETPRARSRPLADGHLGCVRIAERGPAKLHSYADRTLNSTAASL
jgi:hypothetical protein